VPEWSAVALGIAAAVLVLVALIVIAGRGVRASRRAHSPGTDPTDGSASSDARDARHAQKPSAQAALVPGALAPVAISAAARAPATVLDYIDERTIVLDIDESDQEGVIRRLAGLMIGTGRVHDEDAVVRAALARELISTTGIGEGIAIPHAKCHGASQPVLAFARSSAGVPWNSLDEQPAHLIFMIAVPEEAAGTEHLRVLAQLSRSLMKPSFRAAIEMAATPADVLAALASTVRPAPPA
jgi:PTS system fructose-specific IIC component